MKMKTKDMENNMGYMTGWCSASTEAEQEYKKLKKAYLKAKDEKKEQFNLGGWEVLTKYAYYMLQFVEDWREQHKLKIYKKKIGDEE